MMYTTLLSAIVALLLGHLARPLAMAMRRYGWWRWWLRHLDALFDESGVWRSGWGIVIALLPVLAAMLALQIAASFSWWRLGALLLGVIVLFHCWGPRDLDVDVAAVVDAADAASRLQAAQQLWPPDGQATLQPRALVGRVFHTALERWFGPLFWFGLLGPVGALLYRLVVEAAQGSASAVLPASSARGAARMKRWLDWPAAQLLTLSLALVGDAASVRDAWKRHGGADHDAQADFLGAAGRASVREELADEAQDLVLDGMDDAAAITVGLGPLPELRDAMSLLWRCLMIWLLVLAAFVLAGWML